MAATCACGHSSDEHTKVFGCDDTNVPYVVCDHDDCECIDYTEMA